MNYDAYRETVDAETKAKVTRLENQQKELAKAEKSARKTIERQQKHASRGEKQNAKKCVARISMGLLRNKSEATTSRLNKVQQEKMEAMRRDIHEIRSSINEYTEIKIDMGNSALAGKSYLWRQNMLLSSMLVGILCGGNIPWIYPYSAVNAYGFRR